MSLAADLNLVASFLAKQDVKDLQSHLTVDCIILCGSQLVLQAERLFRALEHHPSLTKTVIVVGGIGHSTSLLYDAVARHPVYHSIESEVQGLAESRVIERILQKYFDLPRITSQGCEILFEDQSTNCGSNAIEAHKLLHAHDVTLSGTCVVIQDPTMMLRTLAGFEKAFAGDHVRPRFLGCPFFVPVVQGEEPDGLSFVMADVAAAEIWSVERFGSLVLGEIPRLRNDENGYGPNGRNFIGVVDIPDDVEEAWARLAGVLDRSR